MTPIDRKASRFLLAILLPFLACGLQILAWEAVQPFSWTFFTAAVFFCAWLGGRIGGLIATGISVLLVNLYFMEPRHTLSWISTSQVGSTLMFIAMGTVFAFFHHHLRLSIANQAATSHRFHTVFQNAPFGLALIDPLTKKIYQANPRFSEITGRSPEELALLDSTFIFDPDDLPKILDHRGILNANEIPGFQLNKPLFKPDGTLIWIGLSLSSVPVAPGKVPHRLLIIEDITTQREQQQALVNAQAAAAKAESDLRLGTFLRQGLGGILESTSDGRILKANPRFCSMLGYEKAELLGKHIRDICHPDDWKSNEEHLAKIRDTGETFIFNKRYRHQDGSYRWCAAAVSSFPDPRDNSTHILTIAFDIHEAKQNEQRLALAIEAARLGIWHWDIRSNQLVLSNFLCGLFKVPEGMRMTYKGFVEKLHPDDRNRIEAAVQRSLTEYVDFEEEYRVIWPDSSEHWLVGLGHVYLGIDGQPENMEGVVYDISRRKEAEIKLIEQTKRLAEAQRIAHIGSWFCDFHSPIVWTEETYRLYDVSPGSFTITLESLIGLIHPDDQVAFAAEIERIASGGEPRAFVFRRPLADGSLRYLSGQGEALRDEHGHIIAVAGTVQDVTQQVLVEAGLREQQEHLQLALDAARLGTCRCHLADNTMEWSDKALAYFGASKGTMATFDDFLAMVHPEDRARIQCAVQRSVAEVGGCEEEYRILWPDGTERWIHGHGRVFRDATGKPQTMQGVVRDITPRKQAELALIESERQYRELSANLEQAVALRTAQLQAANAAKSQFLASMSHELRTPMNAVIGLGQLLEDEATLPPEHRETVRLINSAGRSLLNIINDILDFSRIESGQLKMEKSPFNLTEVFHRLESLLARSAAEKGIKLLVGDASVVNCYLLGDDKRLEQILTNLLGNAIKFTQQGEVVLRVIPLAQDQHSVQLRFEVKDTGIGIPPQALPTLFDPFTQADSSITRRFGGTGLGLSICKRLLDLIGGTMGVESTPGEGSTFWFETAFEWMAGDYSPSAELPPKSKEPCLAGLRVLVADDSKVNLYLVERVLKKEGADVTLVEDGQQAVDALAHSPQGFDAVLMDIQMPVMDGLTATRRIREDLKLDHLPIIALTAGVLPEEQQGARDAGINDFLPKPMDIKLTVEKIMRACRSTSGHFESGPV